MEDTIKAAVSDISARPSVDEAVAAYMSYPRAVRTKAYTQLPDAIKKKARTASEERRGISFRTLDGDIVFSRDEYKNQAARLMEKVQEMDARKAALMERVVELKKQAAKFHGDDFLAELEAAIESK